MKRDQDFAQPAVSAMRDDTRRGNIASRRGLQLATRHKLRKARVPSDQKLGLCHAG